MRNGLEEAVGILLDDGVSTEIKDEKGNTLLHLAAERNNMLIVQNLLPRKAQSFALNNELKLPRDLTSDQAIIRVLGTMQVPLFLLLVSLFLQFGNY